MITKRNYKNSILIEGNTIAYKDDLKKIGGLWNRSLKGWLFKKDNKNIETFFKDYIIISKICRDDDLNHKDLENLSNDNKIFIIKTCKYVVEKKKGNIQKAINILSIFDPSEKIEKSPIEVPRVFKNPEESEKDIKLTKEELDHIKHNIGWLQNYFTSVAYAGKIWFTERQIKYLRKMIHDEFIGRTNFKLIANMTDINMNILFELYDKYFFGYAYIKILKEKKYNVSFKISKTSKIAGHCGSKGNCQFEIAISSKVFDNLFKKGEKNHTANGLICEDLLYCILLTFEHELIHLLIVTLTPEIEKKYVSKRNIHGVEFKNLVKLFFGHTETTHQFFEGDTSKIEEKKTKIENTKRNIKKGDLVKFNNKGIIFEGKVIKINKKTVGVVSPDGKLKWKIPFELLL